MTPEELKIRKNYIGGSDAPIIDGKSPWTTPCQLWELKMGLKDDFEGNFATKGGIIKEPRARAEFEKITKLIMFPERHFSKEFEFMMANMDGVSLDGKYAVEIKCSGEEDHELALNNIVPEKYYPQLQHQMCVLNLQMIFYFSFNGKENKLIEVPRNDDYINTLIGKEAKFFYENMRKFIPPELTDKDFVSRNDKGWLEKIQEWLRAVHEKESWEATEKRLKEELISMSGGQNTIGGGVRLTKVVRKGNVDYSQIPQLKGIELDSYRKDPITSWRLATERKNKTLLLE